jgi:hypothetical protein
LKYGQNVDDIDDFNNIVPDEWTDPDLSNDCKMMILIGGLLLACTFISLLYRNQRVGKIE